MANRTDTFNRVNNPTSLGVPSDSGSAWVAVAGTWGINSDSAYCPVDAAGQNLAYLECSEADGTVAVDITILGFAGVLFRYSDSSNYWLLVEGSSDVRLFKNVGGSFTQVGPTVTSAGVAGRYSVELSGNSIVCKVNGGAALISATDSHNATATKHGLRTFSNTTAYFNNFDFAGAGGGGGSAIAAISSYYRMIGAA